MENACQFAVLILVNGTSRRRLGIPINAQYFHSLGIDPHGVAVSADHAYRAVGVYCIQRLLAGQHRIFPKGMIPACADEPAVLRDTLCQLP